ncbi:hypothetical protein PG994_003145 [Apiospora phragmitis]|uniref:Uncharacterized protein n=1 Tax=Apiospora phragmitis TaxID=2905665 RepID=A0ABR1WB03_9PEZI
MRQLFSRKGLERVGMGMLGGVEASSAGLARYAPARCTIQRDEALCVGSLGISPEGSNWPPVEARRCAGRYQKFSLACPPHLAGYALNKSNRRHGMLRAQQLYLRLSSNKAIRYDAVTPHSTTQGRRISINDQHFV